MHILRFNRANRQGARESRISSVGTEASDHFCIGGASDQNKPDDTRESRDALGDLENIQVCVTLDEKTDNTCSYLKEQAKKMEHFVNSRWNVKSLSVSNSNTNLCQSDSFIMRREDQVRNVMV